MSRRAKQPDRPGEWIVPTQALVREFFQIGRTTFATWTERGIISGPPYDLAAITRARVAYVEELQVKGKSGKLEASRELAAAKLKAQIQKVEQEAKRAERQNRIEAGELIPKAPLVRALVESAARIRIGLTSFPSEMAMVAPNNRQVAKHMAEKRVAMIIKSIRDTEVAGARIEDAILDEADRIREERNGRSKCGPERAGKRRGTRSRRSLGTEGDQGDGTA